MDAIGYAKIVLQKMVQEADKDSGVWTGRMSDLVESVAPVSNYSRILGILKGSGAIYQVRRGGGKSPSIWQVMDADAELSLESLERAVRPRRRTLETRISDLEALVGGVNIPLALADIAGMIEAGKKGSD